jgi:hypothetical protein
MTQMTAAQSRVIDPVLTEIARGFVNSGLGAGYALFPRVNVGQRGGRIISFGREAFQLYATGRAPGAATARIQSRYSSTQFALEQHSIEELVPYELMEDAAAVPGIDLGSAAVVRALDIIRLRLEKAQADLARDAARYAATNKETLSGTSQWSHASATPIIAIETAKAAVRSQIGARPNTLLVSGAVFDVLKQHPTIVDRIKYTSRDVATPELLATLFGLERVVVADAVWHNGSSMVDIWGKDAILAYTATGSAQDAGRPSFGYTYQLTGAPMAEEPYPDRSHKSWIYPVTDEVSPVIAGADAGFLFTNAVA